MENFKLFDKVTAKVSLEQKGTSYFKTLLESVCKYVGATFHDSVNGIVIKGTLDQLVEIEKHVSVKLTQDLNTSNPSEKSTGSASQSPSKENYETEPYMAKYITTFCSEKLTKIQQDCDVKIKWNKDGTNVTIKPKNSHHVQFKQACDAFQEVYQDLYSRLEQFPFDVSQESKDYSSSDLEVAVCQVPGVVNGLISLKEQDGKSYKLVGTAEALIVARHWIRSQLRIVSSSQKNKLSHETVNKIKVFVYQGDITKENTDIIVNATNKDLYHGGGVSWAIAKAGGPSIQQESSDYVKKYGRVATGDVAVARPGNLNCKRIVHAVGPQWKKLGKEGCIKILSQVCTNIFNVARRDGFKSIAIPAISSGVYGVPIKLCAQTIFASLEELDQKAATQPIGPLEVRLVNIDTDTVKVFAEEFHKWKLKGRKVVRRNSFHGIRKTEEKPVKAVSADDTSTTPKIRAALVTTKGNLSSRSNSLYSRRQVAESASPTVVIARLSSVTSTVNSSSSRPNEPAKPSTLASSKQNHGNMSTNSNPKLASLQLQSKALNDNSAQKYSTTQKNEDKGSANHDECAICKCTMTNPKALSKCGHTFCTPCIDTAFNYQKKCPVCQEVYGITEGDQPHGTMRVDRIPYDSLPGYRGCGYFCITYTIPSGTQGSRHPNPGQRFHGTSRLAYIPATREGEEVVGLLQKAFERKLVFTIGRSTTTGREDCVTWNDIHHKTSMNGGPQRFGYPDPGYLRRVKDELKSKGIVPE